MHSWISLLLKSLEKGQDCTLVMIANARGSSPRDAGAFMIIDEDDFIGTIGGGALEYKAIELARSLIVQSPETAFKRHWRDYALGPNLGQCCGGHVTLLFEYYSASMLSDLQKFAQTGGTLFHNHTSDKLPYLCDEVPYLYHNQPRSFTSALTFAQDNLYIYGAGHVGRALMDVTSGLGLKRIWVDDDKARFPAEHASDIERVIAKDMSVVAYHAPPNSYHIILTYSHQIDEEIVHAVLAKNAFLQLGLIGSLTKAARFKSRFKKAGLSDEVIDRMICPIGLVDIRSKKPTHVALSIAGQIAQWCETK